MLWGRNEARRGEGVWHAVRAEVLVPAHRRQEWLEHAVAASWRLFQEVIDLSAGVQKGPNALQEKGPNDVTYNSISGNGKAPGVPRRMSAWLMGKHAPHPTPQGGFYLWPFITLDPGEFKGLFRAC